MEYTLGEIVLFAANYCPNGFFECRGEQLAVNEYMALYSVIGIKFGGDGMNFFNLPNLTGSEPHPELRYGICHNGIYPSRA